MAVPEDFYVIAQIAVTLMGFTGIVGALQTRGGAVLDEREKFHIVNLLTTSTLVLFLAFVPTWLQSLPGSDENLWAWSIRVLLAIHICAWIIAIPTFQRGSIFFNQKYRAFERMAGLTVAVLGVVAVGAELLIVGGHYTEYSVFLYEGVLLLFVAVSVFNFLSLLIKPSR